MVTHKGTYRADTLHGTLDVDTLIGGDGADYLYGAPEGMADAKRDVLIGNKGFDTLVSDGSGDILRGGRGADTFYLRDGEEVYGGRGHDRVVLYQEGDFEYAENISVHLGKGQDVVEVVTQELSGFDITFTDFGEDDRLVLYENVEDGCLRVCDGNDDGRIDALDSGAYYTDHMTKVVVSVDEQGLHLGIDNDSAFHFQGAYALLDSQLGG